MNGRTFPTHGAGSFAKFGGVGRQIPGAGGYSVGGGPKRPSFIRAVSIALAVVSPIAIPAALDPGGLSGRACYVRVVQRLPCPQLRREQAGDYQAHEHAERRRRRGRLL